MKKLFLSILAVATLASCTKDESFYIEQDSEIKLAPVASMLTKAVTGAIDGTTYPADENFDVYAYWKNEAAGSSFTEEVTKYLGDPVAGNGVEFVKKGDWFWGGVTPYYWPKNGSLRFAAYSPADLTHEVKHDIATDTYTVLGYKQPYNTAETFDFLLAPTSVSYTSATAVDDVDIVFEHALSWITLKAKAKDNVAANAFTVTDVIINDVKTVADLKAAMPEKIWSNWATPQNYVIRSAAEKNITVTEDLQLLDVNDKGTVIIPQATTTVTVKYTQNALTDEDGNITSPKLENQEITVPLLLDDNKTPWEPGKHYIYTLIFGLDEILITPAVADWEDVVVNDVEVNATNVYTVEELKAALANGGNIVLQADLEATSLKASKDAFLNLNGHTITGTDALTTSYYLIEVQPDVTFTVEGPGTLVVNEATNNRGWNAFSSVLSNQRGTLIVNDGVVVEHLGGTDMAYGIDNLTNTGSQPAITIVNGATVKSTYRAIRQFLNSATGSNELYVNSCSKITGTNKSIWAQNANNKANIGKLVVKEGAQLTGDVMLSASSAPVWAMEASIPASTLVAPSTVVPSNVPSNYEVVLVDGVWGIKSL